jgi:hypothetical protein
MSGTRNVKPKDPLAAASEHMIAPRLRWTPASAP